MLIENANAKINVYLNVTAKRENGYHDIVSIMQTVSLCDRVSIDLTPAEQTLVMLSASGNKSMPTNENNLAYRAAMLFLKETGIVGKVTLHIEKQIPMAAGLAGGSADAAAVFRGLNKLCGSPLSLDSLCKLGCTLGADIPFCIRRGSALVTGIGDVQEEIAPMPFSSIVIACGGDGVSTPAAYGALDDKYDSFKSPCVPPSHYEKIVEAWKRQSPFEACAHFYNIFEEVVPKERPCVDKIKSTMLQCGAVRAMMSGSGPSVFGIFASAKEANTAQECLIQQGVAAFVVHPVQ